MRVTTSRARRMALCVCAFALSVADSFGQAADQAELRRVNAEMFAAYERKDWPRAIELGLKLDKLNPNNSTHQYNLACLYALSGDGEKAVKWLAKSAANGFANVTLFENDADLESVRARPVFKAALEVVKKNHQREIAEFQKKAAQSEPLIVLPPNLAKEEAAPLIVALHPFGETAEWIVDVWKDAAKQFGAILLAPRAVRPAGRGFEWGQIDEAGLLLTRALEQVAEKHKIDPKRIILTGFSQGGYMAFNLGMRGAKEFRGVIPVAGSYNPVLAGPPKSTATAPSKSPATAPSTSPASAPSESMDAAGSKPEDAAQPKSAGGVLPRFFIMVGADDRVLEMNRRAARDYAAAGMAVKLNVYEGVGHDFPKNRDEELRKALRFVLGK